MAKPNRSAEQGRSDGRNNIPNMEMLLIEIGAGADQITARGGGWGPIPHPSAPPDRSIDHLNRMVVISVACT